MIEILFKFFIFHQQSTVEEINSDIKFKINIQINASNQQRKKLFFIKTENLTPRQLLIPEFFILGTKISIFILNTPATLSNDDIIIFIFFNILQIEASVK